MPCYGRRAIVTPSGYFPVLIGFSALLVAVRIGVTVPDPELTT